MSWISLFSFARSTPARHAHLKQIAVKCWKKITGSLISLNRVILFQSQSQSQCPILHYKSELSRGRETHNLAASLFSCSVQTLSIGHCHLSCAWFVFALCVLPTFGVNLMLLSAPFDGSRKVSSRNWSYSSAKLKLICNFMQLIAHVSFEYFIAIYFSLCTKLQYKTLWALDVATHHDIVHSLLSLSSCSYKLKLL